MALRSWTCSWTFSNCCGFRKKGKKGKKEGKKRNEKRRDLGLPENKDAHLLAWPIFRDPGGVLISRRGNVNKLLQRKKRKRKKQSPGPLSAVCKGDPTQTPPRTRCRGHLRTRREHKEHKREETEKRLKTKIKVNN